MKELNQNQLILLTLLVSFVTSIATGIITVSLLQEAPVEVTRNINRIVEKTIETVIPSDPIVSKEKEVVTVVVKEEDLIMEAIKDNLKSVVRINEKDLNSGVVSLYGMGVITSKDGQIATARKNISYQYKYTITTEDGQDFVLTPIGLDKNTNFIIFKATVPEGVNYTFAPAKIASIEPSLGQTLIGLGGTSQNSIAVGRVSSFIMKESGTGTSTVKFVSGIENDIASKDLVVGSPFFNLSGEVVGMKLSGLSSSTFTPATILKEELSVISK